MTKHHQIQIEKDENGMYIAEVTGLPACYTQAKTMPELMARLLEVSEGSLELLNDINNKEYKKFNFSLHVDYASA